MRRALLGLIGVGAILISGCGGTDDDSPAATSNAGAGEGGTLEWVTPERPIELDPLFAEGDTARLVSRQIHEPLVERLRRPFDESGELPGLAAAIRPSDDFRVWELRLRAGVRFQDGTPLNAQAVLANVERWQAEPSRSGLAPQPALFADTPKPGLVRFILERPDRRFDEQLAAPQLGVVAPAALARLAVSGSAFTALGSGTGPFELRERSGQGLLLARNAAWWGTRRGLGPALDQIEFAVLPRESERVAALTGGSAQVAGELSRAAAKAVRDDPLLSAERAGPRRYLGLERSVRGVPPGDPAPSLNSAWLTRLESG